MGYIENNLMDKEHVLYRAKLHWIVFAWPIFWLLLLVLMGAKNPDTPAVFATIFLVSLVVAIINYASSEFGVTDQRVLAKQGFIRRKSVELLLRKAEGIQVDQGIIGRMLGYGTIVITGTGGTQSRFKRISRPFEFRKMAQRQITVVQDR